MEKQKLLIEYLVANPALWSKVSPVLEPERFDKELGLVIAYVMDHQEAYNSMPSLEMIEIESGVSLKTKDDATDPQRMKWVVDEVEKHCRLAAVRNAVLDAAEKLGDNEYGDIVEKMKAAVMVSLNRDLGIDYFNNPKERLQSMLRTGMKPIGFRDIDHHLFGGIEPGGLNIVLANSGVGKSFWLLNVGMNFVQRGEFVAYLSLELSETMLAKRLDAMMTGIEGREILTDIDKVADGLRLVQKNCGSGRIHFKYMSAQSTVRDIEAWLKELIILYGRVPDLLLVDYLDLLAPEDKRIDVNNLWNKDKYVAEKLRALLMEYNICGFTASQLNRGAVQAEEHDQSMISGGISKINTADNVMSMRITQEAREKGYLEIKFLKTRSSAGVDKVVRLTMDKGTMRFSDRNQEEKPALRTTPRPGQFTSKRINEIRAKQPLNLSKDGEPKG